MVEEDGVVVFVDQLLRILQEASGLNRPRVVLVARSIPVSVGAAVTVNGAVSGCNRAVVHRVVNTVSVGVEGASNWKNKRD